MKSDYVIYLFISVVWLIVFTLLYATYIINQPSMNVFFILGSLMYVVLAYGLVRLIIHNILNIKKIKGEKKDE